MAVRCAGREFLVIALYLRPDEAGENELALAEVAVLIKEHRSPYLVAADWNREPADLMHEPWLKRVGGVPLAPGNTTWTCNQGQTRMLDFAVASPGLAPLLDVVAHEGGPWIPHKGLRITIRDLARVVWVRKQIVPQLLPQHYGPTWPWSEYCSRAEGQLGSTGGARHDYWFRPGSADEELSHEYAVISLAYALEQCDRAVLSADDAYRHCGRGLPPRFRWEEALPPTKPGNGKAVG